MGRKGWIGSVARLSGLMGVGAAVCLVAACDGDGGRAGSGSGSGQGTGVAASEEESAATAGSIYGFTMERIDGRAEPLSKYRGKVVLVVNVASECGFTPQYAGLEKLYEAKSGEGLVVLGFPANNFNGQEPGSNTEISSFCRERYGVTFPMFSKISVKGEDQDPLYAMLSSQSEEPSWNFTKYLVGRDGRLVRRFGPRTTPEDPELVGAIDRLLGSG